jgi:hypothetical protein
VAGFGLDLFVENGQALKSVLSVQAQRRLSFAPPLCSGLFQSASSLQGKCDGNDLALGNTEATHGGFRIQPIGSGIRSSLAIDGQDGWRR